MAEPQQEQEPNPELEYEVSEEVPTFYCDSVHLNTGVWGATLYLGEIRPGQKPALKVKIKVSPQMLKAIGLLASKHARNYSDRIGPISLPRELLHAWGLEEEI